MNPSLEVSTHSDALAQLLDAGEGKLPFDRINSLIERGDLRRELEATRLGGYQRLEKFLHALGESDLDLTQCGLDELSAIHGIGLANSRFFVLNTRANARVAVLDRHILAELAELGYDVPAETPRQEREYRRVEDFFLAECDKAGVHPARFNLSKWRKRAQPES